MTVEFSRYPLVIDDGVDSDIVFPSQHARGYVERDFNLYPQEMFAPPSDAPDMTLTEIADRIQEQMREESSLRHIRRRALAGKPIPSLDQNGQGYCWVYSNTMGVMIKRAAMGLPYVRLSAHSVACIIKNFRDEGGWCGLSAQFIRGEDPKHPGKAGIVPVSLWPEKSMNRYYDTPAAWAEAAKYKITEDYVDLARPVYDQNLTKKQVLIQLVLNNPCVCDWNWWGHSTLMLWASLLKSASQNLTLDDFGIGGINSWTDGWGDLGEFEVQGKKSIPDGAVCTRSVIAS